MWEPFLAALFFAVTTPTYAQTVFCLDRQSGQIDPAASQAFADMQTRMDPQLAQVMAKTWYSKTNSLQTGQFLDQNTIQSGAGGIMQRVPQASIKAHRSRPATPAQRREV